MAYGADQQESSHGTGWIDVKCPACEHEKSKVWYSRPANWDSSAIRRRRRCLGCGFNYVTVETTLIAYVERSDIGKRTPDNDADGRAGRARMGRRGRG